MPEQKLSALLSSIRIPPDFARYPIIEERDLLTRLEAWKEQSVQVLHELRTLLGQESTKLSIPEQANVVAGVAAFDGEGSWITGASSGVASGT